MAMISEDSVVMRKTRELCETLVGQSEFKSIRNRIDAFLADDQARQQYQWVAEKGEELQQKQRSGQPLGDAEIQEFEKERQSLMDNHTAREFLEAQEEMHEVQVSVRQYVTKTFELGRTPTPEDFSDGSCGPSCGCHH
jgi:cell fate (sporulation/competence/biofilm development) regulator YlbF (YheA/YmcA/DUF963 family)